LIAIGRLIKSRDCCKEDFRILSFTVNGLANSVHRRMLSFDSLADKPTECKFSTRNIFCVSKQTGIFVENTASVNCPRLPVSPSTLTYRYP